MTGFFVFYTFLLMEQCLIHSPIGILQLCGNPLGLLSVKLITTTPAYPLSKEIPISLQAAVEQLNAYFKRDLTRFSLSLDWSHSPPFYQSVWRILQDIPYGETSTYLDIAQQLGNPHLVRAVGQANRHNPLAIIVPCHRCIAKNGKLQGYAYGIDVKRQLLEFESEKSLPHPGLLF